MPDQAPDRSHLVVVRHHITHPRYLEPFDNWVSSEHWPAWQLERPNDVLHRYVSEMHDPVYYLACYAMPGITSTDELGRVSHVLRQAWAPFAKNMRDFTVEPYEPIWSCGRAASGDDPHPTIIARYSVVPEKESAFNEWEQTVDSPAYLADLPMANARQYRSVVGNPRFQLIVQEFDNDAAMREAIKDNKPDVRPQYWDEWATWMPQVNSLTRLVFKPTSAADFPAYSTP